MYSVGIKWRSRDIVLSIQPEFKKAFSRLPNTIVKI